MSLSVAVLTAIGLFVFLSGDSRLARRIPPGRRLELAHRSGLLAAWAALEELLWRGLVLGGVSETIGVPAAFVLSVGGFALAHLPHQGRKGAAVHLVTGTAFATVYVATRSLAAAIVCHALYNILVAVAVEGGRASETTLSTP